MNAIIKLEVRPLWKEGEKHWYKQHLEMVKILVKFSS